VPQKRVKFWGELHDSISVAQKSKDANLIRRHERLQYVKNRATFKQPVFSFVSAAQTSGLQTDGAKDQK